MVAVPSAASPFSVTDRRDGPVEALARAESAAQVREQILCYPGAVRIPAPGIELYIVRDFLPLDVCATLIALIDADRVPSPTIRVPPTGPARPVTSMRAPTRSPRSRPGSTR